MTVPILDTHIWIWYVTDPSLLKRAEVEALDALDFDNRPFISDFSLWEIATLSSRKRAPLDRPLDQWLAIAAQPGVVRILPVSLQVAVEISVLPERFHRDPADRTLVATARAHQLPVLTRDAKILESGLVRGWSPRKDI